MILAVLLGWLIAGLVGRDLFGLQGASGLVVRLVGCVALGVALSGLRRPPGRAGPRAARSAAGIGSLLGDSLGRVAAIADPRADGDPRPRALRLAVLHHGPRTRPAGRSRQPWTRSRSWSRSPASTRARTTHQPKPLYPERRFDEEGHEIPMSFDARDVGQVRYADEGPDPADARRVR